ncbi:MAG: hypothetical protein ACI9ES_002639 [Oceanospirillaceae bacterium]|jgi:hypothetical protein
MSYGDVMFYRVLCLFAILGLFSCSDSKQNTSAIQPEISTIEMIDFAKPAGEVVLKISGGLSQKNQSDELWLDLATIAKLPQTTIKTSTFWTKGESEFRGPLIRDLLAAIGSKAAIISATAINEYSVEIPVVDIYKYDVILAIEKDGKPLSIRDKGPIWIMYPWSSNKRLQTDKFYARSIWQLVSIELHD